MFESKKVVHYEMKVGERFAVPDDCLRKFFESIISVVSKKDCREDFICVGRDNDINFFESAIAGDVYEPLVKSLKAVSKNIVISDLDYAIICCRVALSAFEKFNSWLFRNGYETYRVEFLANLNSRTVHVHIRVNSDRFMEINDAIRKMK